MNSLTIILYLIEMLNNLGVVANVALVLSGIATVASVIAIGTTATADPDSKYDKGEVLVHKTAKVWVSKFFFVAVVSLILAIIIPSRQTMYLMAGSEVTEIVVDTPEAQAILSDIHEVVRAQLQQLKVGEQK